MATPKSPKELTADYEAQRAKLKRLIHVGKGQLKMDDDTWRMMLQQTVKTESSKDLTLAQLERVLDRLKQAGFKVTVPKAKKTSRNQRALAHEPPDRKIRALWLELHEKGKVRDASEAALGTWIKREFGVEALQWLSVEQQTQAIERLKKWLKRPAAKPTHGNNAG